MNLVLRGELTLIRHLVNLSLNCEWTDVGATQYFAGQTEAQISSGQPKPSHRDGRWASQISWDLEASSSFVWFAADRCVLMHTITSM